MKKATTKTTTSAQWVAEALVYQFAMLATAHQRLAAAVERLGSPPTQETQVGPKP